MSFHDIRFPTGISFGAQGGPERRTEIVTLANGYEERNTPWAHSRRRYDAGMGLRSLDDVADIISFFEARQGMLFGFRWKDWNDFKSSKPSAPTHPEDQILGVGDQSRVAFQLQKTYQSGNGSYTRPIRKPVRGTVRLAASGEALLEGTDYVLDVNTGLVTFAHPPDEQAVITAGFEFDTPVRFDTDMIQAAMSRFQAGEVPNIPVVEIRL